MPDILNKIATTESPLVKLLGDFDKSFVGYVYGMRFDEVLVLTNDEWKHNVNGLPHNSFLVAAGFNPTKIINADIIDQEVILLRVIEPVSLPQDNDFIRTRIEHHQRRTSTEKFPGDVNDGIDPMTHSELQAGGLRCNILGTFYVENGQLRLGSDIENFMTLSRLRAYKPTGSALAMIVNHVNPEVREKAREEAKKAGFTNVPSPINIGTVRYTSTARMHRGKDAELVDVLIQPTDFLARRTAVLGMTRTGKSNTVKTTVSAVAIAAMKDNVKVGQLIFDVNGEYANANHQDDGSSIAEVFPQQTIRYRAIQTVGFADLRTNFYQECDQALNLIQRLFKVDKSPFSGQDLDAFMSSTLEEPDSTQVSEHTRWKRHKAVFQCILYRAGYPTPTNFTIEIPIAAALTRQITAWGQAQDPPVQIATPTSTHVSASDASAWFEQLRQINIAIKDDQSQRRVPAIGLQSSTAGNSWVDPTLEAFLNMLARENSRKQSFGGWRAIQKYRPYHSPQRAADVTDEIINHLEAGKIVILDLSAGPVEIREVLSKRIASQIFERQMAIMNEGKVPQNMVVYVEEAHNLIGKKAELTDTWPRMAKEGAKARIAFVYATQEPSSVHPNILANTENWFVTHLNNDDELRTLGKFYDFGDFTKSLKSAQDVGFARIKTLSAPFVIPTQINRFTPDALKEDIKRIKEKMQPLDHNAV
ncbi:ATP-binding protein [Spirosoma sp.]|uniref:ATP-binding protein n=1 Tax=Spirosoma sp. TaxID=1899569 RepID=UPI003B3B18BB